MFNTACNSRGFSLIEVVIATLLTAFGIIAVLSMQPMSWKTAAKSDYMGRAAGILQKELEDNEVHIMNVNNAVNTGTTNKTVYASGGATSGDAAFTVQTNIALNADGSWTVAVTVTDPRNSAISESIIATRQEPFRF